MLQTRQPLGLEAEPSKRGLPITGSQNPGPIQQTNKQSYLLSANSTTESTLIRLVLTAIDKYNLVVAVL